MTWTAFAILAMFMYVSIIIPFNFLSLAAKGPSQTVTNCTVQIVCKNIANNMQVEDILAERLFGSRVVGWYQKLVGNWSRTGRGAN